MTTSATIDLAELADSLRGMGYDIEPEKPERGRPVGSAIVARRDLGERVVLLVIDQAGRFRADLTWLVGEWPAQVLLASASFRSADRVSREVTLTGQVTSTEQAVAVVMALGTVEPWAALGGGPSAGPGEAPPP